MTVLCFIDTETTGLDPDTHQAYEVCWWREDEDTPNVAILPHTLDKSDPVALDIGGYHDREIVPGRWQRDRTVALDELAMQLVGVTLVGSNPAFDAAFLRRALFGETPWHHRLIDVAQGGMWTFGWDRPKGLADVATALRDMGATIPAPDHTAEGDVRTTRAVYEALVRLRDYPPRIVMGLDPADGVMPKLDGVMMMLPDDVDVHRPRRLCEPADDATCACGRMPLSTTVSERHDRGLHGAIGCIGMAWPREAP